jgi:recombination protein RecA
MAKKKEESATTESLSNSALDKYSAVIVSGTTVLNRKRDIISISPSIDIGLGGGIQSGTLTIFTGKPKFGKTTAALQLAANAQKLGREVYYFNIEGRLKSRDIAGIPGLDMAKFHVVESSPGNILEAHQYLEIAEVIINTCPKAVVIIDSFSMLVTHEEREGTMDKQLRADGPKLLAKFCRKISNVVPVNDIILIGITHVGANVTGYGAAYIETSGMKLGYQVDNKLWAKSTEDWKLTKDGAQIGQLTNWDIVTSALGPPGQVVTSYLRYGSGFDKYTEIANIASELGIIEKGASWYTLTPVEGQPKCQGLEKVSISLKENPEWYEKIKNNVYEMMGLKV